MAIRSDVTVNWLVSPRIITVAAPATEITIQDLVDTCRWLEEQFPHMAYPHLINAAGKEPLGGGVLVGITATLQNAVLQFESRPCELTRGVCTENNAAGITLTAAGSPNGDFVTLGIARGNTVFNQDTLAMAAIISIESEDQLTSQPITSCTSSPWTVGDVYIIFDNILANISGGNLVAIDDIGAPIDPVFQSPNVNVVRTSSSSATISNVDNIPQDVWDYAVNGVVEGSFGEITKSQAYNGAIHVSANNGTAGTAYPLGTEKHPVNNINDATIIGASEGIAVIHIEEDITVQATDNIDGFHLVGSHSTKSEIIVLPGASTNFSKFSDCELLGTLDGFVEITECTITDIIGLQAVVRRTMLNPGTFVLGGNRATHFLNCYSGVPGLGTPEIDFGGIGGIPGSPLGSPFFLSTATCAFRNYSGGVKLVNKNGPESVTVDMDPGQCIIDGTVTAGTFAIRGVGLLFDSSAGTTIVNDDGLVQNAVWDTLINGTKPGTFGEAAKTIAFQEHIHVSQNDGTTGTAYPLGTHLHPVNNVADAVLIGIANGITNIRVEEDITIFSTDNVGGFLFTGAHANKSEIIIQLGAKANLSQFFNCTLTGSFDGTDSVIVRDSVVSDLLLFGGIIHRCAIDGTLQCGTQPIQVLECFSARSGTQYSVIDLNDATGGIAFRSYRGPIKLINQSNAGIMDIDFESGKLFVDTDVTASTLYLRGIYALTNNGTGTFTIIQETNLDIIQFTLDNMSIVLDTVHKYHKNRTLIDENAFTLTVFDDDKVTPIAVFDLKDENGIASITSIFERYPTGSP